MLGLSGDHKEKAHNKECLEFLHRAANAHDHYQLRRFWFEEQADYCLKHGKNSAEAAMRLYDIFKRAIKLNPKIICHHSFVLIYVLKAAGLDQQAQVIFNEWAKVNRLLMYNNSTFNDYILYRGFRVIKNYPELLNGYQTASKPKDSNLDKLQNLFLGKKGKRFISLPDDKDRVCLKYLNEVKHMRKLTN